MSSSSSGEDSLLISGDLNAFNQREDDSDRNHEFSKDNQEPEPEEGGLGAMFGPFDGPSDYPPGYYGHHVAPPSNGYQSWDWQLPSGEYERQRPQRQPGPYPPEQSPSHSQHYRPGPNPLNHHHQHSYVRERPPSHTYPIYGPSKPERRVHFDHGDAETRNGHNRVGHDYHPLHPEQLVWRDDLDYFHGRAGPEYQDPEPHPRGPNPYADYALPPSNGHYTYDAENRAYRAYPAQSQVHGNYHQPEPPMRNSSQFSSHLVQPAQRPIQPFGQQPTIRHQHPGPASFPIPSGSWVASHPQFPYQPVPVMFPPNLVPVPHPVTGMPIYSAPGAPPFFHLPTPANMSNMIPHPAPGPFNAQPIGLQNTMQQTTNAGTSSSGVNINSADNIKTGNNDGRVNNGTNNTNGNEGTGTDSNDNFDNNVTNATDGWNNNNGNQNSNSGGWENNNDANQNNNGSSGGGGWGDANQSNNNVQSENWNNDQTNNANENWNSDQNNNANENWNNDQTNNSNENWNNDQNNNTNENRNSEQNNTNNMNGDWNNDQTNDANGNMDNTPKLGVPGKRSLYGPYGAYFTSKVFANSGVPADAEEEPRYDVPQAIAQGRGTSKQVQPGKGYIYNKKRCAPRYMDTMDEPYARFVFKYRTKEQIKDETGIEVIADPTPNEDVNALEQLDKMELIQLVIRAKGVLGGEIPAPLPKDAAAVKTPTPSFDQVPVEPPETAFLKYSLPPARVASFQGLGIQNSPSNTKNNQPENSWDNNQQASGDQNGASGGNNNTSGTGWNNDNSGGAPGWNDNTQNNSAGGGWGNQQNNNVTSGVGAGWDGQQEKSTSETNNGKRGSIGTQNQESGTMRNSGPQQQQNNSRRSSAISPKNNMNANTNTPAGDPELAAYLENAARMGGPAGPNPDWATPAGAQQPWQTQNQQQPQQQQPSSGGVQTIGTGFIGGGGATTTSLNYHNKPPTPELKPCSPVTVDNGEWPMGPPAPDQNQTGLGAGAPGFMPSAQAAAPGGGW